MTHSHDPPLDLEDGGRGSQFWTTVISEYDPAPAEAELLLECARLLEELELLRQAVAEHGVVTHGSRGQLRTSPALLELRQGRAELRRLLDALALEPPGDSAEAPSITTMTSRRASRAARTRWAGRGARLADAS